MTSLTSALRIATSGMQTSQIGLGTISHNIVNANTAGYSRQVVNTASTSIAGSGSGVTVASVTRTSNAYYFQSILKQQSEMSYASTSSTYLQNIESTYSNNGSNDLGDTINSFFDSVQQLSNEPGNASLKSSVIQQADNLAGSLNSISANLSNMQAQADKDINDQLTSVNQTIKQIYELNVEIARQSQGNSAVNVSDLQDKRDTLIQSLSEDFKLQVTVDSSTGGYRIATESGRRIVDETGYVQFERTPGDPNGIGFRTTQAGGSLSDNLTELDTSNLSTGRIKALIDLRDTTIPNQMAQLDNFAMTFADAVNQISSTGTSVPAQTSLTFTNVDSLATATSDLFGGFGSANVANTSFNISLVDANGNVIDTTAGDSTVSPAVAGAPITLPGSGPYTLTDLMNAINNDPNVGNTALGGTDGVVASITTDGAGVPTGLTVASANGTYRVVISNASGNLLGTLGMNNLFTGTSAADIAVRSDIAANPAKLPVATMSTTDGSLSSLNNDVLIKLGGMMDTNLSFSAAGGLSAQNATSAGYVNSMLSTLSVNISSAKNRESFATTMLDQVTQQQSSVSGVNLNEELGLMLVYQQSFQASARIISTVDNMLQELMQTIG